MHIIEKLIEQAAPTSNSVNSPESLAASAAIRRYLKKSLPGATVTHSTGHFYCSGFVRRGQAVVYYMSGDYRGCAFGPYVRTAKDEKDYTGGANVPCTWDNIAANIDGLLKGYQEAMRWTGK